MENTAFSTSIDNEIHKKYLTKRNIFGFSASGFGQNMIISVVNSYLMYFYTDIFIIEKSIVTIFMTIARIWDVINDPLMGVIVDKTRSKRGKLKPYLQIIFIPLGLTTCLLFLTPQLTEGWKIAYAAGTYLLWGMTYTVCDIPFWSLPAAMTRNTEERTRFISFARIFHSIGGASPYLIIFVMELIFKNDLAMRYKACGIFCGVVGGALFYFAYKFSDERFPPDEKVPTIRESLGYLKINKPLQRVIFSHAAGFGRSIAVAGGMYISTVLIGDIHISESFSLSATTINTVLSACFAVMGFAAMLCTPKLCEKYNYVQLYRVCMIIGVFASVMMLICGAKIWSILIWLAVAGLPYGLVCNINYSMISDSIDYVEWKTGQRAEGITISFQTFTNQMCSTLQTYVVLLILLILNYRQPQIIDKVTYYVEQTPQFKSGLFTIICLVPVVSWIASYMVMRKYDFVGEKRDNALRELAERRKGAVTEELVTDTSEE